jgi:uncharacterized protein (TIGR00369 family)
MFTADDPDFSSRVRRSFGAQQVMHTIGASLQRVEPGVVAIALPSSAHIGQQHGYVHAGVVATIGDSACGYAAMTLAPPGLEVLTVEYKINLLAPARGETFLAVGSVLRRGRLLTVCRGDVFATASGVERLVATMQATIITLDRAIADPPAS